MKAEKVISTQRLVPWIIYLIFFAVLNETMFNVSTPMIARQFSLSPAGVSWMMSIFMVFFGIGAVVYGRLSDLYSLRRLIFIGITIYSFGSVMGFALRFSYPLVIAARAIQGIGGSAIPALVFVVVTRHFAESERGRIFGLITSTVSFAIGLGPVVGGFVAGRLSWAHLFLVPLLILVSLPFLGAELPREERKEGRVDFLGAALVALSVGALILFLNFTGWYYLAAFVGLSILLIIRIVSSPDPFIKPSLFRNVRFRGGIVVAFCLFSIVIGILFLIPLMLNDVHGLDTSQIGLVLFPGAISSVVFGPIGGSLADRRGNGFVVSLGLFLLVLSLALMSILLSRSVLFVAFALLLTYVGFSLFQIAVVNSVSQTLPPHETGVGMGLFNLVGIISGAMGTAIVGKILAGGWLDFPILPLGPLSRGHAYSNLMLAFGAIVVLGGLLYARSFRPAQAEAALEEELLAGTRDCLGCES